MHVKRHLIRQRLISANIFFSIQSFMECCASAKCTWIRFSVEVTRQKLYMDMCLRLHVNLCFTTGYRHHCGCTGVICCSQFFYAEENTRLILSEDGLSLSVLGSEHQWSVVIVYLLFLVICCLQWGIGCPLQLIFSAVGLPQFAQMKETENI